MPEINESLLRQMHETNSKAIEGLQENQKEINQTLTKMHGVLERIDERLNRTDETEKKVSSIEDDMNKIKGIGRVAGIVLTAGEAILLTLLERRH